jgi:pantothenate kinase
LNEEEAQARAWLAKRQREHGKFKKVAEGRYFIKANTDLEKSEKPSVCSDVWTLSKSGRGDFEVAGVFTKSIGNSDGYS